MKRVLVFLVLLVTRSCTFQVNVLDPQTALPAAPTAISLPTGTLAPIIPTSSGETQTAIPTITPSPLSPVTLIPGDPSAIIPIVFAPNATAEVIAGAIRAGESQVYSLNAFEGQIMSISILADKAEQQNTYQLEIKDRNGEILCPLKNHPCFFWRGGLPSTGEYLIKVTAQGGGTFRMRVAINPPGTVSQKFNYTDPGGRFTLIYPDDFAEIQYGGTQITKFPATLALQYIDTQQFTSTNLIEAYFLLGTSEEPGQVSSCTVPLNFDQPETELGDVSINGIDFKKSQGGGVGAGNIYEQIYYRAVYGDTCYEVSYFVHYGNIGAYSPGTVTEFDRTALYQELDGILASLILK